MFKSAVAAILALALPLAAGAQDRSKRAYELIYDDVQLLKQQVLQIQTATEQTAEALRRLQADLKQLTDLVRRGQTDQAGLREELRAVPAQSQTLGQRLDQMSLQITKILADLEALRVALPPAAPAAEAGKTPPEGAAVTPRDPSISPQDAYNAAYNDYLQGNFDLAIQGFVLFREQFPESPLTENALYWIGECLFSQRRFEDAIARFDELILHHPLADKAPAAHLKKGMSYLELGRTDRAIAAFKLLLAKHPASEEAKIAEAKIKELMAP